jgi:predicted heme/steroid binding protein
MTNFRRHKKIALLTACLLLLSSTFMGFSYQDGIGNVSFQSSIEIFEDVKYEELIAKNATNGVEHAYIISANNQSNEIKAMVFNGEVRATYTLQNMIKYAEEQGYIVLAGINGDIFDTATGTPKGLTIVQGNILTSGYAPELSLAFDDEGKASMQNVSLSYGLKGFINSTETVVTTTPAITNILEDGTEVIVMPEQSETTSNSSQKEFVTNIDFFNVPQGGSKGLHLFNRHYSNSTKTSSNCVEVVIDTGSSDNIQLKVNNTIKGVVKSVNINTSNTPIGDSEVVLSTVSESASASILSNMVIGSEVEISAKDNMNTGLENAVDAMGIYYSIVADGKIDTTGTNPNPRTVLGIKKDGSLVLYVLDGRQPAVSNGLGLIDTAKHMIALGCVSAFNMDGGGSSVLYARLPGLENDATLKNSPSQLSERSVSNGLLLVYKKSGTNVAENLNVYPELSLCMPGADVQISTYASNNLYEKVSVPGSVSYSVSGQNGNVSNDGLFTAGDSKGRVVINATSKKLSGSTEVEIIDPADLTILPSVMKLNMDINQTAEIDVNVKYGEAKVNSKDSLFSWSCDPDLGLIDQNGKFVSTSRNGMNGNIYIGYNGNLITIPVTVGKAIIDFTDTIGHWARDYIGQMASRGLIDGVGDNMFMPDMEITRAQYLAMLAKTVPDLNLESYSKTEFIDVNQSEWYYKYVNWGYGNSIVSGLNETTFAPNDYITREQMTIMLCNFSRSLGIAMPQISSGIVFPDTNKISVWAADYVATVVGAGIMNGDSTGVFMPSGLATRAQAAKTVFAYNNIKDGIE